MKEFLKKYKWYIIVGLFVGVFIIPLIIHLVFKMHIPCNLFIAEWSAGDVLAFYGVLLGAITTIFGVYASIEYAQRNYREDEINRSKPYFALSHYLSKPESFSLDEVLLRHSDENISDERREQFSDIYQEYRMDKVYIVIGESDIQFMQDLPKSQERLLQRGGVDIGNKNGSYTLTHKSIVSIPFEIENVGNGAATNTIVAFYEDGKKPNGLNLYTQKVGQSSYIHIFSDNFTYVLNKRYMLELIYNDILGNRFSQKYPIEFKIDDETGKYCNTIDLTGLQTPYANIVADREE